MKSFKRFEESAYVLDFIPHSISLSIKGREGLILHAIGGEWLTLLEILAMDRVTFVIGEKLRITRESREKIISVLGRLEYKDLTDGAKNELLNVCEKIVRDYENKYVTYFNELQPVTPRKHALQLISGIGKKFIKQILKEREKKPFESFEDIQTRVGLKDPAKRIAKRLVTEISGQSGIILFVKR